MKLTVLWLGEGSNFTAPTRSLSHEERVAWAVKGSSNLEYFRISVSLYLTRMPNLKLDGPTIDEQVYLLRKALGRSLVQATDGLGGRNLGNHIRRKIRLAKSNGQCLLWALPPKMDTKLHELPSS